MLFKNIYAFTLNESEITESTLSEKLEKFRIQPVGKFEEKSVGWDDVLEDEENLLFKVSKSAYILNLKTEEKSVPSSVVGEHLKKRIKEIIKDGGEYPSKKK